MIFTSKDPRAHTAQVLDENGDNLCKKYFIKWYNTETQTAGVVDTVVDDKGRKFVKPDGLGGFAFTEIHFPGSKLVLVEPLKQHQ